MCPSMDSIEYPATVAGVKRGLKAKACSQGRAADDTGQSRSLVSMVLSRKATSQPCLDKLAAFVTALPMPAKKSAAA
jgi:hypothetical protein